jgi:uncharacterized protein (TIGR03435 family)
LVMEAYSVKSYQIALATVLRANESQNVFYDISARAPGESAPTRNDVRKMLQTLLADRFKLAIHREMKEMPVYALVADKNGPKLKESKADGECTVHAGPPTPSGRNYEATLSNCAIDELVDQLRSLLVSDRPVVDKTGLTGKYDIRMVATPEYKIRTQSEPGDISTFSAVQDLGLKLESVKAPIEVINIDQVEKPSEN